MTILILGLALWWAAHLFKRLAPGPRARLGSAGMGLVALALLAAVGLMVWGFRSADYVHLWSPPRFLTHLNNLLMVLALYLALADALRARVALALRHPQLSAFKAWAVAHLLVNGDLASVLLFGGLLAWAVVTVIVINRAGPRPPRRPWGGRRAEIGALLGTPVALGVIGGIHNWLGYWPFG